jgi:hypothetical protein
MEIEFEESFIRVCVCDPLCLWLANSKLGRFPAEFAAPAFFFTKI